MKRIYLTLRKIIIGFSIIFVFNFLNRNSYLFLPLNKITVTITSILGIYGLLFLIIVKFIVSG